MVSFITAVFLIEIYFTGSVQHSRLLFPLFMCSTQSMVGQDG